MQKALEVASILLYVTIVPFAGFAAFFVTVYALLCTKYYYISLIYFTWVWLDRNTCHYGGRRQEWVTNLSIWKYAANYFPVKVIKTAEIDPNKNYLCGYHPHGISAIGAISVFAFQNGFKEKFPGMKSFMIAVTTIQWIPFLREVVGSLGFCASSKESISWILTKEGKGNLAVIGLGGANEALYAYPGNAKLILKNRKGFVRIAIKTGASLIPIFAFGENELYGQPPNPKGSLFRRIQDLHKGILGYPPLVMFGRRILPFTRWSHLPVRQPIDVVVGKPIDVAQNLNPTDDDVNNYHNLYVESLIKLYEDHKTNYDHYKDVSLEIL